MSWHSKVLVVANQTVGSDELRGALCDRAERGPVSFTLLVPAAPRNREEARRRLADALERLRAAGLDVGGSLGADADPAVAVAEIWDPRLFDEVVVSTLPTGVSRWLKADLPHRIWRLTDVPVQHVVAADRAPASSFSST